MASSLIDNALRVNFDSIMGILDNDGMVKIFRALESTGLRGFLGCPTVFYEDLAHFFDTTLVKYNEVLCVIHGKVVVINEDRFVGVFGLPTEGLTYLSEVPMDLVFDARSLFSQSVEPVKTSCKTKKLKYEFRLLNDILAKSVTVKAGSFDAVTHERFVLMTAIHFGLKVNWRKLLFDILKDMAEKSSKRAKGYADQICALLKGDPVATLGEVTTFPPLNILSAKTVSTYVATNKTIDARGESDEPDATKVAVVERKYVSKKRSASTANKDTYEVQVEIVSPTVKKKRTAKGRAAPAEKDLALVTVAQDVVPIQIVEPISAVQIDRTLAQKRKAPKRKLRLSTGSDDEIVEKEPYVESVVEQEKEQTTIDDVDNIIEQVLAETAQMETNVAEPDVAEGLAMRTELVEPMVKRSEEDDNMSGFKQSSQVIATEGEQIEEVTKTDEESMSIEDLLKQIPIDAIMPSVIAAEPTRRKFGHGIQNSGVNEVDQYKASLPRIAATDKGKEPLVVDTIQGHPAREIFSLICADIDFLVQSREQFSLIGCLHPVGTVNHCRDTVGPFVDIEEFPTGFRGVFRSGIDTNSFVEFLNNFVVQPEVHVLPEVKSNSSDGSTIYRSPSPRSALSISYQYTDPVVQTDTGLICTEPSVQIAPAVYIESDPTDTVSLSQQNPDIALPSPSQSSSNDSSMQFNTDDIPLGADTVVEQILMPTIAAPSTDLTEQFAQPQASISQLSIKQMRTQSSIGNLQNHLLSKIDDLEKASTDALLEFKKGVRAQSCILTTELADIRKEIKDQKDELSKEFDDRLAAIRNDVIEFRVETQEQLTTLRDTLAEIMAYITRGRDDKKGEVGSSQGRGQPLLKIEANLDLEMVVVVVAEVSLHEKEEAVVLNKEIGDIGFLDRSGLDSFK
ncbi:hypothetical protein F511_37139 [Dorcoceras hygrometricum]|uniref:Dystroglycan-like n=1 Tax=Dorcoceras hygrometricum TaxID=472368 RepID=A0A2Z7A8G3_9LAMI|nr:hypothetical protein F511_37139 [Dorcoceras hygrometricum]